MSVPRIFIAIIAVVILLLLILSGLYLSTPILLSWQIDKLIQQQGCGSFSADFQRPKWTELSASELTLKDCPNGIQHLNLKALTIEYRPEELLNSQRLQKISVDEIAIQYQQPSSSSKSQPTLFLPSQAFKQLPLSELTIGHAEISISTEDVELDIQANGNLTEESVNATIAVDINSTSVSEVNPASINLDLKADQNDHFSLVFSDKETELYRLTGSANLNNSSLMIDANDHVALEPLLNWLKQSYQPVGDQDFQFAGTMENHWQIEFPISDIMTELPLPKVKQISELNLSHSEGLHPSIQSVTGRLNTELDWHQDRLEWQLKPHSQVNLAVDSSLLPDSALSETWRLSTDNLSGAVNWQEQRFLSNAGELKVSSLDPQKPQITAQLSSLNYGQHLISSRFNTQVKSQQVTTSGIKLENLQATMKGLVAIHENDISLKLNKGSHFQSKQLTYNTLKLNKPKVVFSQPLDIRALWSEQLWQMSPIELGIAASQSQVFEYQAKALNGELSINPNKQLSKKVRGRLKATFHQLVLTDASAQASKNTQKIGSIHVNSPFTLNYPSLSAAPVIRWPADAEQPLQLSSNINYRLDRRKGQGQFQIKPLAIENLAQIEIAKPFIEQQLMSLQSGILEGHGDLSLSAKGQQALWKSTADITLNDANLLWQNWSMDSFDAEISTLISYQGVGATKLKLTGSTIKGVTALSDLDIKATYLADKQQLQIDTAQVKVLGGMVETAPFNVDLRTQNADLQLEIENVQLPELLKLQTNQDIEATGLINGHIPITIENGLPSVSFGYISSLEPGGKLAYIPPNADQLASNPGMKIALQAMNNFHYHHLSAQVHYQSDGTLWLDTALKGHNPGWQNGQPIDFNIRIEQNLLKLLQALQFSDNLSEGLDQQIRQRMQ